MYSIHPYFEHRTGWTLFAVSSSHEFEIINNITLARTFNSIFFIYFTHRHWHCFIISSDRIFLISLLISVYGKLQPKNCVSFSQYSQFFYCKEQSLLWLSIHSSHCTHLMWQCFHSFLPSVYSQSPQWTFNVSG